MAEQAISRPVLLQAKQYLLIISREKQLPAVYLRNEVCSDLEGTIGNTIIVGLYLLTCRVVFCIEVCVSIPYVQKHPLNLFSYPIIAFITSGNYDLTLIYTQQIRELLINTTFIFSGQSTRWCLLLSTRLCQVITCRYVVKCNKDNDDFQFT